MRRHIAFECQGDTLVGTIDPGEAASGLLIVTGGNELRCGPYGSHAELAAKLSAAGFPVMRFDRRGVGDSCGYNGGFTTSESDIAAALAAFRAACPRLKRIAAFGNCDGASGLMLARGLSCDALVLANPWTFEPEPAAEEEPGPQSQMTPGAIRAHYLRRLTSPRALLRLLTGKVRVGQLAGSLVQAVKPPPPQTALVRSMTEGITDFHGTLTLLVAENDRTAQVFLSQWQDNDPRIRICPDAGHSFIEPQARLWLQGQLLGALHSLS